MPIHDPTDPDHPWIAVRNGSRIHCETEENALAIERGEVEAAIGPDGVLRRKRGGQQRDSKAARIVRAYRVHPTTAAAIEEESERTGESQGQVVDRLATGLRRED